MERNKQSFDSLQSTRAESMANYWLSVGHKITTRARIRNIFELSVSEMRIFNRAFSYYLQVKESKMVHDLANNSEIQVLAKIPLLGLISKAIFTKDEADKLTTQKLKALVDESKKTPTYDGDPTPIEIINAANFLSTKYLKNPYIFDVQIDLNRKHLLRLLGKSPTEGFLPTSG